MPVNGLLVAVLFPPPLNGPEPFPVNGLLFFCGCFGAVVFDSDGGAIFLSQGDCELDGGDWAGCPAPLSSAAGLGTNMFPIVTPSPTRPTTSDHFFVCR